MYALKSRLFNGFLDKRADLVLEHASLRVFALGDCRGELDFGEAVGEFGDAAAAPFKDTAVSFLSTCQSNIVCNSGGEPLKHASGKMVAASLVPAAVNSSGCVSSPNFRRAN